MPKSHWKFTTTTSHLYREPLLDGVRVPPFEILHEMIDPPVSRHTNSLTITRTHSKIHENIWKSICPKRSNLCTEYINVWPECAMVRVISPPSMYLNTIGKWVRNLPRPWDECPRSSVSGCMCLSMRLNTDETTEITETRDSCIDEFLIANVLGPPGLGHTKHFRPLICDSSRVWCYIRPTEERR